MVNCKFELASTITWIYILNDQPSEPIRWKYGFNMPFFILIIKSQIKESFLKENDDLFYDFTYSLGFGKFNLLYCLWSSYSLFVYRKVVLENFANFTGKHLLETLFLIAAAWSFIKKETLTKVFPCEFCEIFQNTFFNRTVPGDCFCLFGYQIIRYLENQQNTENILISNCVQILLLMLSKFKRTK